MGQVQDLADQVADLLPLVGQVNDLEIANAELEMKVEDLENAPVLTPELDYFFLNDSPIEVTGSNANNRFELWDDPPCVDEGKIVTIQAQVAIDPLMSMMDGNNVPVCCDDQVIIALRKNGV